MTPPPTQITPSLPPPPTQSLPPPPPTAQNVAPPGAFPGSLTPGWNDPPAIHTDAAHNSSSSRRPRLDLRKRVAYPMNGNEMNIQQTLPQQPPF